VADGEITWRGLTLGGDVSDFEITEITGWEDLGDVEDYSQSRARGHGEHPGDLYARARIVSITGEVVDSARRDALAAELRAATGLDSQVRDLTVDLFGQVLTAGARLLRRSITIDTSYVVGGVRFALQWRCPDPLRYGPAQPSQSVGLPSAGGGLTYPLAYPLDYGAVGEDGSLTLTNLGTAPAPIVLEVRGPLPEGFEVSAAGQRLRYPVPVPAGQVITIDTGAGTVLVEGTADRRANLTIADWMQVPAMMSLVLQFTALGSASDPGARLTVPGFRAAHW
jgi:hypothetical protein